MRRLLSSRRQFLLTTSWLGLLVSTRAGALTPAEPIANKGLQLLMVEQKGCVWCERWHQELGAIYPKTSEGQRAPMKRIDISQTRRNPKLKAPAIYTPTFIVTKDGLEIGRITGYRNNEFFWAELGEILKTA